MARKTIYMAYNQQGKLVGVSDDKDALGKSLVKGTATIPPCFREAPNNGTR